MLPIDHLNDSLLNDLAGTLPPGAFPLPPLMRIPDACRWSGCTRTRLYQLAGNGVVVFRKMGKATLVDTASLSAYLRTLPAAVIKQPNAASKAS